MQQEEPNKYVKELTQEKYKYGFTTEVHTDIIERGLNEDVIRLISSKKDEPEWLLEFRLKAYRHWLTLEMPTWAHLRIPEIDYQAISYYADPTKKKEGPKSMDEVDPELIKTFNKLGIPLEEQMALSGMAVDAVMDSVSVKTTFKETLMEKGIIFCSFSEAVREHPDLVASSTFIILSAAVSVAPCLKNPETVRTELPMRISVTQSGRRSVLVVLVCFVSVIGSPFAASSVALSVPAFPVRFPFGSCCP